MLTENINQKDEQDKTSLMTLHSAKGLEFDYVFLPGWEEGIFPNQRNIDEYGNKGLGEKVSIRWYYQSTKKTFHFIC